MKLINQSAQYLPQQAGIDGIYKAIELAGRTSYLSWDKMTDGSAKKFVDMLIKSKHTSVLEHGTVYLHIPFYPASGFDYYSLVGKYVSNPYSKVKNIHSPEWNPEFDDDIDENGNIYITTNLRVLQENGWLDDLKYLCEPTEFHEKRLSIKVITDIEVTREFNRHRTFSIVEQSTRYCNFSKDKFDNEVTYIIPFWSDIPEGTYKTLAQVTPAVKGTKNRLLFNQLTMAQDAYITLIEEQCTAQEARAVLPLCTKTEVVYTAFESDWRHFFDLRLFGKTGEPHPQMKQLAELIKQEFEKAGVWEGIMKYPSKYE